MTAPATSPELDSARARPKRPANVYAAITMLALVLFAARLTAVPPQQVPTIAEIAPQAVAVIDEPPPEQATDLDKAPDTAAEGGPVGDEGAGTGQGGSGAGDVGEGEEVPRLRKCVGEPPRQIEDPQAPPCVAYWDPKADNGGATWKGVTADEVLVAIPDAIIQPHYEILEEFFNSRFEFYGRQLRLIGTFEDQADCPSQPIEGQIAAAVAADEERGVFASLDMNCWGGMVYANELARREIVHVSAQNLWDEPGLRSRRPYLWSYNMGIDRVLGATGEWICKRLQGNAEHAGNPLMALEPRQLGVILEQPVGRSAPVDLAPLRNELVGCGIPLVEEQVIPDEAGVQNYNNAVLRMKDRGATTVLCLCHTLNMSGQYMNHANNSQYYPEWLVNGYTGQHVLWLRDPAPTNQVANVFGISFLPRDLRASDDPAVWALNEVAPDSFRLSQDTSDQRQDGLHRLYRGLLLLASGVQMAGPNLTPQTFERGLQAAAFPNPDHPIQAGKVGFQGGSYSMTTDATEVYWNVAGRRAYQADSRPGAFCFVDGGSRWRPGTATSDTPFFAGDCDTGLRARR